MLRGPKTIKNRRGMAAAVVAMLLLMLNTAVWMVMNTGNERLTLARSIAAVTGQSENQRIVDIIEPLVTRGCEEIMENPRTHRIDELRGDGIDLTAGLRRAYQQHGFLAAGTSTPDFRLRGHLVDDPNVLPSDGLDRLVGLRMSFSVGRGTQARTREFTMILVAKRQDDSLQIEHCEPLSTLSSCYYTAEGIRRDLPVVIPSPTPVPTPSLVATFDSALAMVRTRCFGAALKQPAHCSPQAMSLGMGLRTCLAMARASSQLYNLNAPGLSSEVALACTQIVNQTDVRDSCGVAP